MAQLKSTVVAGDLSVTGSFSTNTISNGTWNGSTIAISKGGTGATSANAARTNLNAATGNGRIFYGTCSTAAAAATKIVICEEYDQLTVGDVMIVTFTNTNTTNTALEMSIHNKTSGPTVQTEAKDIKCQISSSINNIPAVGYLVAQRPYMFVYDGTYWVMMNVNRDNNTNTLLRTYTGNANHEYPLLAQNSAANATAAWTEYTSSYKDYYGVIPNSDTTRATINLSTGKITVPGGIIAANIKRTDTSAWSIVLNDTGWTQQTNAITASGIAAGDYTCNKSNSNIPASTEADLIMGLALNNTADARAEAGAIGLRLYEVTSGGVCKFTATAVPTNTINVVIKALV